MIFIANNTREIEKNNLNLKMNISKISENLKINKIELAAHQIPLIFPVMIYGT